MVWRQYRQDISGLTLVELLFMISVGALAMSLVIPGFSQARCRNRTQSCASNLRQLSTAVHAYSRDNDGMLPYAEGSALPKTYPTSKYPKGSIATSLREQLKPYMMNDRPLLCPNDCGVSGYGLSGRAYDLFGSSYLWNDGLERSADGTARLSINGASLSSIQDARHTPMCWDYSPQWHQQLVRKGMRLVTDGRVNTIYVDGHVSILQPPISAVAGDVTTPSGATIPAPAGMTIR